MSDLPLAVLFDRVEFGVNLTLGNISAKDFVEALADAGIVQGTSPATRSNLLKPKVSFASDTGLRVEGQLALSQSGAGLTLTNASSLLVNGIRFIRGALEFTEPPPLGLDGNDNVFGPFPHGEDASAYLEAQLEAFSGALDQFLAVVRAIVPAGRMAGAVRVRSCELTHDMAEDDAPALGIALSKEALANVGTRHHSFHPIPEGMAIERGTVTCSWIIAPKGSGLRLKTYPKRHDLMRLELMIRNRNGIRRLVELGGGTGLSQTSMPSGDQAVEELRAIVPAAADHLERLRRHIREAPTLNRSHLELLVALSPLLSVLFRPDNQPGPQLSSTTVDNVYDAIFKLLTLGEYHALKQDKGQPLRDALELMAKDSDALLQRSPGRSVHFVVRKEWTPARLAIARTLEAGG